MPNPHDDQSDATKKRTPEEQALQDAAKERLIKRLMTSRFADGSSPIRRELGEERDPPPNLPINFTVSYENARWANQVHYSHDGHEPRVFLPLWWILNNANGLDVYDFSRGINRGRFLLAVEGENGPTGQAAVSDCWDEPANQHPVGNLAVSLADADTRTRIEADPHLGIFVGAAPGSRVVFLRVKSANEPDEDPQDARVAVEFMLIGPTEETLITVDNNRVPGLGTIHLTDETRFRDGSRFIDALALAIVLDYCVKHQGVRVTDQESE